MADDAQEADQASLLQSIAEDSLSQSEFSPSTPAFSPSISLSSESSNESTENRCQRQLCIRNPPIFLNYDRVGSPSNLQHASIQPLQVTSRFPMFIMLAFCPWYYSQLPLRIELYCMMKILYSIYTAKMFVVCLYSPRFTSSEPMCSC